MSNVHDGPKSGQATDPSVLEAELLEGIRSLGALAGRLIEARAPQSEEGPRTDREPPKRYEPHDIALPPAFALRSDGRVLMRFDHLEGRDVGDREVWSGFVLLNSEAAGLVEIGDDALQDYASRLVVRFPPKKSAGDE